MKRRSDLSQYFLRNPAVARRILAGTNLTKKDTVYEIGAGTGVLTRELGRRCAHVLAIEIDERLVRKLVRRLRDHPNIVLFAGDFLLTPLPRTPYKVCANIPFNQTAAIMRKLLIPETCPTEAYLVMEYGAAQKFISSCKFGNEIRKLYQISIIGTLPGTDYLPPQRVRTVLVRMMRK